jgi:Asp-tRNA(Asn)/Glu-tRNA(Gln) amidotransferase A subunit family amidase
VNDLLKASAASMAQAVRKRELSPVELVQAHIERAEELNGALNAIVLPRFEEALAEARTAERALEGVDPLGPLHGVPFTAKECIEVAGMPCCDGSRIFEGNVSTTDATVIQSLREAGAILLGKTNIPEFAFHYDSTNLVYGATANPHDHSRSVGGSSGGEAAALAACMTPFGVGADYGGSIRVPAHFCGVVGLRPGRWVVPYTGHFPRAQAMTIQLWSEIGPMARHVDDLQLLLPIFASPSPSDPDVAPHRVEPKQPESLRVALFDEDGFCPVKPVLREAVASAGRALAERGHEVVEERPPNQAEVREVFVQLALAETAALLGPVVEPRKDELSPQIARMFRRLGEADMDLAAYAGRLAHRLELERAVCAWLEQNPIAIAPVGPVAAFPIGTETIEIEGETYEESDLFTLSTYVNALGLPAAAVPVGRTPDGLPVGVQVIGRRYRELEVLAVARELEEAFGGWLDPDEVATAQA